jgi:hypothetical protein
MTDTSRGVRSYPRAPFNRRPLRPDHTRIVPGWSASIEPRTDIDRLPASRLGDHRFNHANLVPYDRFFNTIVPPEERSTRELLERIITSYFQGLTDHQPIEADDDTRCDRYHSGNRVTHNSPNGVEDSGDMGC